MGDFTLKITGTPTAGREYRCESHGPFELVVDLATSRAPRSCPECGAPSERTVTANVVGVMAVSVTRGKSDEPPPYATTTAKLGRREVSMQDWKKERAAMWAEKDRKEAKLKGLY